VREEKKDVPTVVGLANTSTGKQKTPSEKNNEKWIGEERL